MTKLLLHIGPHKTGSTYIQSFFLDNREQLLKLGVNYPNIGLGGQYGQHEAVEMVKTLEQGQLQAYLAQFIGCATNFVSSENFDRLTIRDIKKLSGALSGIDVHIVYYYRNYVDLLPSWWQEDVKHGSMVSLYEFVLPHILRPFGSTIVNPATVLDLYADTFGKEKIKIVNYDLALQKGNILRPIFAMLDVEFRAEKNEFINSSLQLEIVEIIRALNIIAKLNNQWNSHQVRSLFLSKKHEDAIITDVDALATVIRAHMKPLRLAGGFFQKSVEALVRKEYGSCFFNGFPGGLPNREILVPSDNWMLKGDTHVLCERIYRYIMATT